MKLIDVLNTLDKYNKHQFDITVDEQIEYMSSLGKPKDDFDRSYKQYLCQNYFFLVGILFSISVLGIPVILQA